MQPTSICSILLLIAAKRWPDSGPKISLTQAVQLFNGRGTLASIQKAGRDIEADQAKANEHVVEALASI
jgi:hypothetical protein